MKRVKLLGLGNYFGYTIVEALIFLAVSGALIVSAGTLISGRQEKTRFAQAVDDVSVNLVDLFNDTSTGYYPSDESIGCSGSGASFNIISATGTERGTNSSCIFAGKLIEFPLNSTSYTSYTMVSNRNATSLSGATIKLVGKNNPGIADTKSNNVDVRVTKIVEDPSRREYTSIAVLSDFGNVSGSTVSGNASKLKLYGYTQNTNSGVVTTNNPAWLVPINGSTNIVICLRQDGNDSSRIGSVKITPQLTVERTIGSQETVCT